MDFNEFLAWERASHDTIDVKRCYIDLAGDLNAGLMLSQIIFWHLPNRNGASKLRVNRNGHLWIVKARFDWWDEIRIKAKQADRALRILKNKQLIVVEYHRFDGLRTTHIRLNKEIFLNVLQGVIRDDCK